MHWRPSFSYAVLIAVLFAATSVSAQEVPPSEGVEEAVPEPLATPAVNAPMSVLPVPQPEAVPPVPGSAATQPSVIAPAGVQTAVPDGAPIPPPVTTSTPPASSESGMEPKPEEASPQEMYNILVLQGLNKVTAKIEEIIAPVGTVVRFGNLEIIARACWQAPPEARPENAALLEVSELKPGEQPARIFAGWMFSSSPALSALEHPVYDLTVIRCEKAGKPGVSE